MLSLESKLSIPKDVLFYEVSNQVDDEMVILNLATSQYYSLDDVGTRMWLLIHEHGLLKAVHQAMQAEYAVEPGQLEHDLLDLSERLLADGLVQLDEA